MGLGLIGFVRCLLLPHQPNRRRVKKRGNDQYVGYCRYCGAKIRRVTRDKWKRDNGEAGPETELD